MAASSDIQAAEADGRIPDGVSLQYLAESRDGPAIAGILFMVCFTGIVLMARLSAGALVLKRIRVDDGFAVATMITYITFVALSIVLINMGSGRHIEYIKYVMAPNTVRKTQVLGFAAHIVYTTALLLCRLSGLAFYAQLVPRFSKLHKSILVAAPLLFAAYLPQLFVIIFHCRPITAFWPYTWKHDRGDYKCMSRETVYAVNSGISLACDLPMFIIPAIIIKRLQLPVLRKILTSLILFPGIIVIIISATHVWLVVRGSWSPDNSWPYSFMLCVENAEVACTLVALSIPVLKPLLGNVSLYLTGHESNETRTESQTQLRPAEDGRSGSLTQWTTSLSSRSFDESELQSWSGSNGTFYEKMPPPKIWADPVGDFELQFEGIRVTTEVQGRVSRGLVCVWSFQI